MIGNILIDLFGARKVGIIGAATSTLALSLSIPIEIMQLYFLTYSILFGIGQALLCVATMAILPHYKLSSANGLANLIATALTAVLPILSDLILKRFSVKGMFTFLTAFSFISIYLHSLSNQFFLQAN